MARYHATVESRCSATETFRCLSSFSNAAEWDPGVLAGGAAGSRPGRYWQPIPARRAVPGLLMSLTYEVIRCVPGHEVLLAPPAACWGPRTDRGDGRRGSLGGQLWGQGQALPGTGESAHRPGSGL